MAWASKKQYAILMGSDEGKDLVEQLPDLDQETFNDKFAELLGKSGGNTNVSASTKENKLNDNNKKEFGKNTLQDYASKIYQDSIGGIHSADKIDGIVEELYNEKQNNQANEDEGYAKGTSKKYTDEVNKGYDEATKYLSSKGIDAKQFKTFKDVTHYMKNFLKQWEKEGNDEKNEPIFDALDKIFDKFANDDFNKKAPYGRN